MSDTDRDPETAGRRLLQKSQTRAVRERMRAHVETHEPAADLKSLRREAARGTDLSETVIEDRDERV